MQNTRHLIIDFELIKNEICDNADEFTWTLDTPLQSQKDRWEYKADSSKLDFEKSFFVIRID